MRWRLLALVTALLALATVASPGAHATGALDGVTVAVEPRETSVVLGDSIDLGIRVTNAGPAATAPLVLHLDATDPERSSSVDPEDWTATLSRPLGILAPGATVDVVWTVQPISRGTFAAYAVALSADVDGIAASNLARVVVVDRRSLNPGGVLPVSVGAPTIIGLLLLVQFRRARAGAPRPSSRSI